MDNEGYLVKIWELTVVIMDRFLIIYIDLTNNNYLEIRIHAIYKIEHP